MQSVREYLQQPKLAKYPFLFVVTYGRSGSTLLMGLLNSLPRYHISGENDGALIPVYRATERLRHARYQWGTKENLPQNPWYGAHRIMPDLFARDCADAFFRSVLRPPLGTRCCGFKEIRYTDAEVTDEEFAPYLDFMATLFPGAAFVFNLRSIEAASKSGWWKDQNPDIVFRRLAGARDRMMAYAQLRPQSAWLFDYDVFVGDPSHFKSLCEFLGERFDEERVRAVASSPHSVIASKPSRRGLR